MAQDDIFSSGGTLEFLKLMGTPQPSAAEAQAKPDSTGAFMQAAGPDAGAGSAPAAEDESTIAMSDLPHAVQAAPKPSKPRGPVVIKGGPRRIMRADGRQPRLGTAMGRRKFEFSSGDAMFVEPPSHKLFNLLAPLVVIAVLAGGGALAYAHANATSTEYAQEKLIGTTGYDGALSLTPARDGGYYTVFLVTSTTTDESQIGDLSSVVMYRCDKDVTTAVRINVPHDLYVTPYSSYSKNYYSLDKTLKETQNITRALQSIIDELGVRLYNVVCCDQAEYDKICAYMSGSSDDTSVFDESALLGRVRTNLSAQGLLDFCTSIRSLGYSSLNEFTVPTTDLGAGDVLMRQASSSTYQTALAQHLGNIKYDANGNYYGTQYDENGNPLLDERGNPQGAVYVNIEANQLYFDENGYLVFYGQHYDANGYPVGTQYDENGNALLDANGNPQGTQYDENGDPQRDWIGNIVINNG